MGIPVDRIISLTFIIGSALAGAAGLLVGVTYGQIKQPADASWILYGLKAFVAAVIGGIGNLPGAMLGGLLLGLSEQFVAGYVSTTFRDAISNAAASLRVGNGLDEGVQMGPVITPQSKSRVESLIATGEKQGAKVLLDGRNSKIPKYEAGNFVNPTILDGCSGRRRSHKGLIERIVSAKCEVGFVSTYEKRPFEGISLESANLFRNRARRAESR